MDDLVHVVNESAACNVCQLVGTQDGKPLCLPEIGLCFSPPIFAAWVVSSSTITSALSGTQTATAEEDTRCLLLGDWSPSLADKPPLVPATGLSLERRRYLFERIRDYCREDCKAAVCSDTSLLIHQPQDPTCAIY